MRKLLHNACRRAIIIYGSLVCALSVSFPAVAQEATEQKPTQRFWDKVFSLPAIVVPIIVHSPETKWGFGLGMQSYFHMPFCENTSIIYFDACYTLNKQYYLNVGGTFYFEGNVPWFMRWHGGYRNYPDTYFGIGNTLSEDRKKGIPYISKRGTAYVEAPVYLPANWSLGPLFDFTHEQCLTSEAGPTAQQSNSDSGLTSAAGPTIMWGLGAVAQYDTRDTIYYPHKGLFFKASVTHYEKALGSTARMTYLQADLRQFITLPKDIIFAWQFKTEWALSDDVSSIPFPSLPTLGGQDLVRGVRRNMFRDNVMMALQAEFRFPIWSFFRFHAFAGIGDVYNTDHWTWATPKIGYGIGLRVGIHKARINLRLDIARSNVYKEWNTWESYAFYLTATEAF